MSEEGEKQLDHQSRPKEEEEDQDDAEYRDHSERFNYQRFKLNDYQLLSKNKINDKQFGYRKYSFYIERNKREKGVRGMVRELDQYTPNLTSSGAFDSKGMAKTKSFIFSFLGKALAIASVIGLFINQYHKPQAKFNKISSASEQVYEAVHNLAELLKKSSYTETLLISAIKSVGQLLNESSLVDLALAEIKQQKIVPSIWKFIGIEGSTCEKQLSQYELIFSFSFLHDISTAGGDHYINTRVMRKIVDHCDEFEEVAKAYYSLLMTATSYQDGLNTMKGLADPIVRPLLYQDYGPWFQSPISFFAIWSHNGNLTIEDRKGICKFVDYTSKFADSWTKPFKSMFCLLSKHIHCDCMDKLEMEAYYQLDECKNIFSQMGIDTEPKDEI